MAASAPPLRPAPRPPAVEPGQKFKPRSFEDQVRYAYHSPAPVQYSPQQPGRRSEKKLGKISDAKIPSALDHGIRESALVPGPGSYDTPDLRDIQLPEGGRLSRKPPEDKFKIDEYPQPAPGAYGVPADPTVPRQLYGSFGKDPRITKFIQDQINLSKGVPAPGAHDVLESMESMKPFCPEGGRYLEQVGRPMSYFETAAKLREDIPGPGRYNSGPGSVNPHKAAGKLVWKYQSETLESSKKVINRVCGTGHENPAPGHYTLPDPAPLNRAPSLIGRSLAHGMPHPYAYNCAPDHSGKFEHMSPVRMKNAGDQIYGRDLTKNTRPARATASADAVVESSLPRTLAERDIDQPGETVQWRSGGFASLRKVKSSPIIERTHPTVEETMQRYKPCSKKFGRKERDFAPLAHRRPEIVRTHSTSDEYQSLQRKKWELDTLNSQITAATALTLEPLDEEKLRTRATKGLIDKAKFRMRMEGMRADQQDLVLAEFPAVLLESQSPAGRRAEGVEVVEAEAMADSPFDDPLSAQGADLFADAGDLGDL